jgi:TRAP-type C4-dicarboxylate transport system substrate-binding protein
MEDSMKAIPRTFIFAGLAAAAILFLSCQQKQGNEQAESLNQPKQIIYKLELGHDMPVDSAQHVAALHFADIVKQRSNGRVNVQVFPAQQQRLLLKTAFNQITCSGFRSGMNMPAPFW